MESEVRREGEVFNDSKWGKRRSVLLACLRYPTAASAVRARTMSMVSADKNWLPVADKWRPRRAGAGTGTETETGAEISVRVRI